MTEWAISEVARATGLTSRTLRHYEQIGLLIPSRVAESGYRYYGTRELSRLYRILSLRSLAMPLDMIKSALDDEISLGRAMSAHLAHLEDHQARTAEQIRDVRRALDATTRGRIMTIDEMFAGVDDTKYESEVRERWGDEAWERSAARRDAMTETERHEEDVDGAALTHSLQQAAERGIDPKADAFQALISEHHAWITRHWNGRAPDRAAYLGLGDLYVTDPRFAAAHGGESNARIIRTAMTRWADTHLG